MNEQMDSKYATPKELAARWRWHEESVRRFLRQRRLASVIIGRRRLIPITEIIRVEQNGFISQSGGAKT